MKTIKATTRLQAEKKYNCHKLKYFGFGLDFFVDKYGDVQEVFYNDLNVTSVFDRSIDKTKLVIDTDLFDLNYEFEKSGLVLDDINNRIYEIYYEDADDRVIETNLLFE